MTTRKLRGDALKLERLRMKIRAGAEAIARGDYVDVDDAELEAFIDRLGKSARTASHSGALNR